MSHWSEELADWHRERAEFRKRIFEAPAAKMGRGREAYERRRQEDADIAFYLKHRVRFK